MDIARISAAPAVVAEPRAIPVVQTDKRPTADSAALARAPRPEIPMPLPPSLGQAAEVGRALLSTPSAAPGAESERPVTEPERVLKPYGLTMLPSRETDTSRPGGHGTGADRGG